jgi:hypothetical protein
MSQQMDELIAFDVWGNEIVKVEMIEFKVKLPCRRCPQSQL